MLKFLLVVVILSEDVGKSLANPVIQPLDTMVETILSSITAPKCDDTNGKVALSPGNYNFHATHQTIYLNAPHGVNNSYDIGKVIRPDYTVTNGIGAHKIHHRQVTWNNARRICYSEGGHLAVIRSEAEEKIILQTMIAASVEHVWVGLHDKFEEGNWVTVLDEPIEELPWPLWAKNGGVNPDNFGGTEHCGVLIRRQSGMNDDTCTKMSQFVCKISTN